MRQGSWLLVLAILATPAAAAPPPASPPAVKHRKELRADARKFAQQFAFLTDQVARQYFRPVPREDLLDAGVAALYRHARKAPPRDLKAQLRQAASLTAMLRTQAVNAPDDGPPTDPLEKLLIRLREELGEVEDLSATQAMLLACKALPRLLDPHSGLVTAEEQRRNAGLDNESIGVGLTFKDALTPGPLVIDVVQPGSPGQRLGLKPGDVITRVEGAPVEKASPAHLLALRGTRVEDDLALPLHPDAKPTGPKVDVPNVVKVHYRRGSENDERTATLLRERHRPETVLGVRRRDDNAWDWWVDEKARLAHVRVTSLSRGTADDVRDTLVLLREEKLRGLILDLRWCPGGYLNEAVEIAELFLGTCVIATIKNRGREDTVYRSTSAGKHRDFAVVVLVNGETSGGAELIAAALQDQKRAVVVGQRTLGKASVQTPLTVGVEGTGFKLTSGTFVRPGGINLHRFPESTPDDHWGVVPDVDARVSADLGKRLKGWWIQQSLRPARSAERLPLDARRADPQQMLAEEALRRSVDAKSR